MFTYRTILPVIAAALLLVATRAGADDLKIGKASATKNQVEGVLRDAPRSLTPGSDVFANELVRTGDGGLARLVFLDNTDLAVGPKSEVRLDRFVYDPNRTGAGSVIVQMGRGAFRFVTGKQDSRNYTINTPYATLGVRGTVFEVVATPEKVDVHLVNGAVTVTSLLNQVIELGGPANNTVTVTSTGTVIGPYTTPPNTTILTFDVASLGDATGTLGFAGAGGGGGSLGGQTNPIGSGSTGASVAATSFPPSQGTPTPPAFTPLTFTSPSSGPSTVSQSVSP